MRVALLVAVGCLSTASAGHYDGWKPHRYCNDLDGIEAARVPPLTDEQAEQLESLEQVQVLARHGARAPYARLFCWDEKHHNPMNAEWTCTTTSVSSQDIGFDEPEKGFGRLYGKTYVDGLNILDGNCVVGGLLPLGRQQHLKNGLFLRDAYIGEGPLKIFPTANLADLSLDDIYLRSDDEERTLGSGQALIDGLFPPDGSLSRQLQRMLTWHVADISTDYIDSNQRICPMMGLIADIATSSEEFTVHNRQPDIVELNEHFQELVGNFSWDSVLECLSVARCNDLPLPDGIDEDTFTKVFHEVEVRQGLFLSHNDSWYAKVAMQPLAHEILSRVDKVLSGAKHAHKFAVTMAHDSTLMPFLSAIQRQNWDRTWTPYAGMLILELYKTKAGSHATRMVFHGEPVIIPECGGSLCDIKDFLKAFEFARTPRHCKLPKKQDGDTPSASALASSPSSSSFGASQYLSTFTILGLVALCAIFGIRLYRSNRRLSREEMSSLLG